jgi:hypothetical protein
VDSLLGRLVARGRTGKAVCDAENEEQLKALLEQRCCHGVSTAGCNMQAWIVSWELEAGSWELVVVDDMSHGQNRCLTFREEQKLSPDTVTESSLLTDCPRESFIENRSSVLHEYSVLMEFSLLRHPPTVLAKVFTTLSTSDTSWICHPRCSSHSATLLQLLFFTS